MWRIRTLFWVMWWALCGRFSVRGGYLHLDDFNYHDKRFNVHRFDMRKHWHSKYEESPND
jgi:hypothetical protein